MKPIQLFPLLCAIGAQAYIRDLRLFQHIGQLLQHVGHLLVRAQISLIQYYMEGAFTERKRCQMAQIRDRQGAIAVQSDQPDNGIGVVHECRGSVPISGRVNALCRCGIVARKIHERDMVQVAQRSLDRHVGQDVPKIEA